MKHRGVTGRLPAPKLKELPNRHKLTTKDWRMIAKLIQDDKFLISQGYIAHAIGEANFVRDTCPVAIREIWLYRNLNHKYVLELLCNYKEDVAISSLQEDMMEYRRATASGVCTKVLEMTVEDVETDKDARLTPQSIADKYIARPRKSRFYK